MKIFRLKVYGFLRSKIEQIITRMMIWFVVDGYGCDCPTKDIDDDPELIKKYGDGARCPSCKAREVKEWLENHLSLIEEFQFDL